MVRRFSLSARVSLFAGLAVLAGCAVTGETAPAAAGGDASSSAADAPDGAIAARPMPARPLDLSKVPIRIVFGSCLKQNDDQSIWNQVRAENPDLVLLIGDNVYGDVLSRDPSLPELKAAYMRLADSAPFARLRAAAPLLTVWDDHDYGLNDAGADFALKEKAEALYNYVWAVPENDQRRTRPGVYGAWMFGEGADSLQLIMLDTRYFRSPLLATDEQGARGKERYAPDADPEKTMLGAVQWAWLADELKKPAGRRIIVSSIQVIAEGHGWEAWRMLPAERDRLYRLFRDSGLKQVTILSGDRHAGGYYKKSVYGVDITEVTSSSLNAPASKWRAASGETYVEPGPFRIGAMVYEPNYGLIEIGSDADEAGMTISLRGEAGQFMAPARAPEGFAGVVTP